MNITEILSDVYYSEEGQQIYARTSIDGSKQDKLIVDIRGYGFLSIVLGDQDKAANMQDEIGKFIVKAIKEKIRNDEFYKNQRALNKEMAVSLGILTEEDFEEWMKEIDKLKPL